MRFNKSLYYVGNEIFPYRNHWIADAGFFIPVSSGYDPAVHSVHLTQIYYRRPTLELFLEFRTDVPSLACYRFVFVHPMDWAISYGPEPRFLTYFASAITGSCFSPSLKSVAYVEPNSSSVGNVSYGGSYVETGTPSPEKAGWGYLTVGDFRDYFADVDTTLAGLGVNDVWTEGPTNFALYPTTHFLVEPARVQTVSLVQKIEIANKVPTFVPDPCYGGALNVYAGQAESNGRIFTGDVKLKEGFNCQISVSDVTNEISIDARVGAGAGASCGERGPYVTDPYAYGQYSVLPYGYYDRSCRGLIHTINGQRPDSSGRLQIQVGNGVQLSENPPPHTIVITADAAGRFVCPT